jgi:hypothetical protein
MPVKPGASHFGRKTEEKVNREIKEFLSIES